MKYQKGFKKITVVLVSDSKNGIKQFRLPRFLLPVFALLLLSCTTYISWIILDYQIIRAKMTRLVRLQEDNKQQKRQFLHIDQQIGQMKQRMGKLKELNQRLKVMVDLGANDDNTQFQGIGGSGVIPLQSDRSRATYRRFVQLMHYSLDNLNNEINVEKQEMTELYYRFIEMQKTILACTPSIWPTRGSLSSLFGYRLSPFTGKREFHNGIDIYARINSPIVVPADGFVASIGWHHNNGKTLTIKHGYGMVTKYAHLNKVLVKKGQYVKRGETIALLGNTGRSTGPHLHYTVYLNGVSVDPLRYILN